MATIFSETCSHLLCYTIYGCDMKTSTAFIEMRMLGGCGVATTVLRTLVDWMRRVNDDNEHE